MTLPLIPGTDPDFEAHDQGPDPSDGTAARQYGDAPEPGDLLTLPDAEAAALAVKLFTDQRKRPDVDRRMAQWEVNRLRRAGYAMVEVQKLEGQNRWIVYQSPVSSIIPGWNKADDLCEKLVSQRFVDPPGPEPIPATGEPEDIEAAEFAERVLRDVQGEGHLDDLTLHRDAADLSCTYSRAAIRYWVDAQGMRGPVQIEAAPGAVSADQPFLMPGPVDPMTGQPQMVNAPPPYRLRYVTADGRLTDTRAEAAERWYPKLCGEVLTPKHYRFLPATALDVWRAEGVAIGVFRSVAELRGMFPDQTTDLSDDDWRDLAGFRPSRDEKDLWPEGAPRTMDGGSVDDLLVFAVTVYYKSCAAYPKGAYVCAMGKDRLLHRQPWEGKLPDGTVETLDLPLTESVMYRRGRREYVALMELLGPANEQRAAVIGHLMQYLDDFANRATFYSQYGTLRPEDLDRPGRKYLPYVPGHQPVQEEVPPFPPAGQAFFEAVSQEMDAVSDLTQTAQGVEDSSVTSGAHAREIRSATLVNLSGLQQNDARAYTRGCRIQLQLIRTHFTAPQLVGWVGEDGQYRSKYFSGLDLRGAKDVRLKKGTLTGLSATNKAQEAIYYASIGANPKAGTPGIIPTNELREILADRVGGDLGLKDNKALMRVRRQIAAFMDGPPPNWQPPQPQVMGVDPMTGQPVVQTPADPALAQIFAPLPSDDAQDVAQMRYLELRAAMDRVKFQSFPQPWQAGLLGEYERARRAAGVATVAEQQQAQAQMAQQQMAMKQADQSREDAKDAQARDDQRAEGEQNRQMQREDQQNRAYLEQQKVAMQAVQAQNAGAEA